MEVRFQCMPTRIATPLLLQALAGLSQDSGCVLRVEMKRTVTSDRRQGQRDFFSTSIAPFSMLGRTFVAVIMKVCNRSFLLLTRVIATFSMRIPNTHGLLKGSSGTVLHAFLVAFFDLRLLLLRITFAGIVGVQKG